MSERRSLTFGKTAFGPLHETTTPSELSAMASIVAVNFDFLAADIREGGVVSMRRKSQICGSRRRPTDALPGICNA